MFKILRYKKELFLLFLISVLYFAIRIPNLTVQPIFADEAIYIRWAQVMKAEPTLRFLPLTDGKTPLFMWALMPIFKIFDDPVLAGRILSVFSGFGTLVGVFLLGWRFFNIRVGLFAALFITLTPYIIFFDRMALVDSMLSAFTIWSLLIALLLTQYFRIDLAMLLGYLLGAGLLTKPPGFFNVLALPTTLLALKFTKDNRQEKVVKLFLLWIVAIVITLVIYNLLRLGPGFSSLNSRNQDYVFSPLEILPRPLDPFLPHLGDVKEWIIKLWGFPIAVFVFLGIGVSIIKRNRFGLVILFWSLVPFLIQTALLKTFTARYLLFSVPPLLILGGLGIDYLLNTKYLKNNLVKGLVVLSLFVYPVYFVYQIHTNPENLPLPRNEKSGYFETWTAGYGMYQIAGFLNEESKKHLVVVGTEGSFGTLPDGLQIHLDKNRQVVVIGGKATISAQLRDSAKENPTYFVGNSANFEAYGDNIELINSYPKAIKPDGSREEVLLMRVYPETSQSGRLK